MKLYTAVLKEIEEQKSFSAHDITLGIRDKVNGGDIVVETPTAILLDNRMVANIEHTDVNAIVQDIHDNGILPLTRDQGPGYWLYKLNKGPTLIPRANINFVVTPAKKVAKGQVKILSGFTKSERHEIYTKVATYVSTKRKNKDNITLKGISSALKTKGITVNDVLDICNKLNYKVVHKSPKSLSVVK